MQAVLCTPGPGSGQVEHMVQCPSYCVSNRPPDVRQVDEFMTKADLIVSVHVVDEPSLDYLRQCLNSIIQFTPRELYTLTCVIDRGYDGTAEFIRDHYWSKGHVDFVLYNRDQQGYTRTNNIGLERSEAEWAVLLNLDLVVNQRWLEDLIDCGERSMAGVVGCKLLDDSGLINHAGAYGVGSHRGMNELNINYFEEEEVEWVTGACFMINKKLRDAIGNLDEYYPHWGSDREYCLKAREAGFKVMYSPVTITHYTERSNSEEVKAMFKDLPR